MNTIELKKKRKTNYNTNIDGRIDSAQIQDAIEKVNAAGGGRVSLGAGKWVCATIMLRSFVELHLERGCIIIADTEFTHYTSAPHGWSGTDKKIYNLIVASGCEQTALTGPGVIDGSCDAFWEPCSEEERPFGIFRYKYKGGSTNHPQPLIELAGCCDLTVDGITIKNSPAWTLHVYDCDHAAIRNVTIRNNRLGLHTDGIGINSSRDVRVSGCDVDTGDDAIIVKSTNPDLSCERITISNCVSSSNCSAFGLGADAIGDIRDVIFTNCVSNQSLRMIQIEQWYPGLMERVIFSNISGKTFPDHGIFNERPIYVDIQQWTRPEKDLGNIRDISFHNIFCETRGRIVLTAQDGSTIENVSFDNVFLRVPEIEDPHVAVPQAKSMQLSNYNPETRNCRAAIVADNVVNMHLRDVMVEWPEQTNVPMHAISKRNCKNIRNESPELIANNSSIDLVEELQGNQED